MRLAESVSCSKGWLLAGAGIVCALALRPAARPATTPIVEFEAPHELTM
jgi:hypothetical protein